MHRYRALFVFLACLSGAATAGAQLLPGVNVDMFPGRPDPWAGTFSREAFIERYASTPEDSVRWPGMIAELFFVNAIAARNACLAGEFGPPTMYDCVPKVIEQHDIASTFSRPDFIKTPGEHVRYRPENFYCRWWQNQLPNPGHMPQNPIQVSDPTRPEGLFHAPPEVGWACPVYYYNVLPDEQPPPPPVCAQDGDTLCLRNRFEVEISWETETGSTGAGHAIPLSEDTGSFWFFKQENLELLIKVLDGCGVNNHFWVFAGGLTNVEVQIRVKDTTTGAARTYTNPQKTPFAPLQDINAFDCP